MNHAQKRTCCKAYLAQRKEMNHMNKENNERLNVLPAYFSATGNTTEVAKTVEKN
jgi:hypothetical protein